MKLYKYGSKLPNKMLAYLKETKIRTGISVWRLIYDALKAYFPDYKE